MEMQYEDMTLGFERELDFKIMTNGGDRPGCSLRKMKTRDESSYVITYSFVDALSKTFGDSAEAFYIDGINEGNREKAAALFNSVFDNLVRRYQEDNIQIIDMKELVDGVIEELTPKMGMN